MSTDPVATEHSARVLATARLKHMVNMILLAVWTIVVGAACWTGGAAKERIANLEAVVAGYGELREQDQRTYGIIEEAKAKTVAVCDALGGKNCEETSK